MYPARVVSLKTYAVSTARGIYHDVQSSNAQRRMGVAIISVHGGNETDRKWKRKREKKGKRGRECKKMRGRLRNRECSWEFIKVSFAFCVVAFKGRGNNGAGQ